MPGLNQTPEEWSTLEWAVNCTDICAQRGLESSSEQICPSVVLTRPQTGARQTAVTQDLALILSRPGGSFLFCRFLTRVWPPFSGPGIFADSFICFCLFCLFVFLNTSVIRQHGEHSGEPQEDPGTHEQVMLPGKAEKTVWGLCQCCINT